MDSSQGPKVKAVIRPAASVLWEEPPAHFGGAYSKILVRPQHCRSDRAEWDVPEVYLATPGTSFEYALSVFEPS